MKIILYYYWMNLPSVISLFSNCRNFTLEGLYDKKVSDRT